APEPGDSAEVLPKSDGDGDGDGSKASRPRLKIVK
ncbi:ClpXP protease specificity-enhancing factor, partial [Burkholderia pseudomallei]